LVLREIITDRSRAGCGGAPLTGRLENRYLIVVARNQPALYEHLRHRHGRDPSVRVVVDRRGTGDGDGTGDGEMRDGSPPVERRRRRSWLATGASHELVELRREDTTESPSPNQQPSIPSEEARRQMKETETFDDPQRVTRWLAESQQVLGRVLPTLIEDRDRVRQALQVREHECERLTGELGGLRLDLGAARRELETLRDERVAMAEACGGIVDLLGQLQRPLDEIMRRLHSAQPVAVETSIPDSGAAPGTDSGAAHRLPRRTHDRRS